MRSNDYRKHNGRASAAFSFLFFSPQSRHFFPSLSLSLPPTHLLSPESKCHSVAQPLSSLCCTLTLLHISSYWSVPPCHTTEWLIIHFIIPPTTHTHTNTRLLADSLTQTKPQGGEQTYRHPCRGTQCRGTPRHKRHIIFQINFKLPQTTHHALQLPTWGTHLSKHA